MVQINIIELFIYNQEEIFHLTKKKLEKFSKTPVVSWEFLFAQKI